MGLAASPRWMRGICGDSRTVPTFTDHHLAEEVPSSTPAASPWSNRSSLRGLNAEIYKPNIEMDIHKDVPSAASAHIHQVRAVAE